MPGEKADVALEVFVDKRTAGGLNSGQDKLYDILVPTTFLHIVLVSHSLFIRIYLHCHGDLDPLIFLNLKLAPLLCSHLTLLQVLHLMGGKDIFITVSGTYIR